VLAVREIFRNFLRGTKFIRIALGQWTVINYFICLINNEGGKAQYIQYHNKKAWKINDLFLARRFIIEKFSEIFIYLKETVVVESIAHAVVLVHTESFLHRTLTAHTRLPRPACPQNSRRLGLCAIVMMASSGAGRPARDGGGSVVAAPVLLLLGLSPPVAGGAKATLPRSTLGGRHFSHRRRRGPPTSGRRLTARQIIWLTVVLSGHYATTACSAADGLTNNLR
jgi:hypothetical protein